MSTEDGHKYRFGPPATGWPSFGPDGKRITEPAPAGRVCLVCFGDESRPVGPGAPWCHD